MREQSRVLNRVNRSLAVFFEILLQKRARMHIRSTATTINVNAFVSQSTPRRFTAGTGVLESSKLSAAWKIMFLEILGSTFPDINHRLLRVYARLQQLSNVNYPHPINLFVQVANMYSARRENARVIAFFGLIREARKNGRMDYYKIEECTGNVRLIVGFTIVVL